jgi:fructose-1,6-bisphosphatase
MASKPPSPLAIMHFFNAQPLAGGQAINSKMQRMLEVVPSHIHDRSGIFLGSYDEVQKVIDMHKKHGVVP